MRRAVAQDFQGFGVFFGNKFYFRILINTSAQIQQLRINLHCNAVAGKSFGNTPGHIEP